VSCKIAFTGKATANLQKHKTNVLRSMKNLQAESLQEDLSGVHWHDILSSKSNVNDMLSTFNEAFLRIWDKHAPLINRRVRKNRTPWMNHDVLNLAHQRNSAYNKYLRSRSDEAFRDYKILRNAVTSAARRSKRDFFIRGAHSGCKQFWRHIKQCTGLGRIKQHLMPWPSHNHIAAKVSANRINDKFVDSVTDLLHTVKPQNIGDADNHSNISSSAPSTMLSLKRITATQIRRTIDELPSKASSGHDGISTAMLKKSPMAVMKALEMIFNSSISAGQFPDAWRYAIVTPVYKRGDIFDPGNYRPIALLPLISKVFEKLINQQLRDYLQSNNILNEAQHGFRQGHSCQTALLRLTKLLFTLKSAKQYTYVTTFDYSRAFDTVNWNLLCQRLSKFADTCTAAWFTSYLNERRQSTKYCDATSDVRHLSAGVPEGSVLGPTLYILYINNLLNSITPGTVVAYADDITIVSSGCTPAEAASHAESVILHVYSWSTNNGLILNLSKCYTMFISCNSKQQHKASDFTIGLKSERIKAVDELKILGVLLTADLKWTAHATRVRQSVSKMTGVLNRFGCSLNTTVRCRVLCAFILPKLTYCLPVWCAVDKRTTVAMDHVLQRAARVVLHDKTSTLSEATYDSTGILPFSSLSKYRCLTTVHSLLSRDDAAAYILPLFSTADSQRSTRSSEGRKFMLPRHNVTSVEHCFHYYAANCWNDLPYSLTQLLDFSSFNSKILRHILSVSPK
jgi:Reverse transcriptase (RNA-dependent DNA polymerase)